MYIITERLDDRTSHPNDPRAQAVAKHSGLFDIRDLQNGRRIVTTSYDLRFLRKLQATANTRRALEAQEIRHLTYTSYNGGL